MNAGPWTIEASEGRLEIFAGQWPVAKVARADAANARLIAAAPALLAACKELQQQLNAYQEFAEEWFDGKTPEDWLGRSVCANAAHDQARAAITAAEGRADA